MDTFLIKATQLIMAFALLVIIHEFGHFLFARIFGVKVEKFYIFFDPWTELFKWKPKKYIGGFKEKRRNLLFGVILNTVSGGCHSEDIVKLPE